MSSGDVDTLTSRFKKLSISSLLDPHRDILKHAVTRVLSTSVAEETYGQIIDGLPIHDVIFDTHDGLRFVGHPLINHHLRLSPAVLDQVRQLRDSFNVNALQFDSKLIYAYQAVNPGSKSFQTRLIELAAIAIHQIAVLLFKQKPRRSDDDPLMLWQPSKRQLGYLKGIRPPTLVYNPWYKDYDQYPEGIADGVGYWAEGRILGGVVLFDRRTDGTGLDDDSVYFHSDAKDVTYRVYRLLDEQKRRLVQFLSEDTTDCPVPIHGGDDNRTRVDAEEPISKTGIYRDIWERRPPGFGDWDMRLWTVFDPLNYTSFEEFQQARVRGILWMDYGRHEQAERDKEAGGGKDKPHTA